MTIVQAAPELEGTAIDDPQRPDGAGLGDEAGRGWMSLAKQVLALTAVVLALASSTRLDASWNADDGVYAVQTKLVRDHGHWEYPYVHADMDPEGAYDPVHAALGRDGNLFPLVKHRTWIMVLVASSSVFGEVVGLHIPSYAGLIAAAALAWFLANALRPGMGPWAFWAVGLGPLLTQSTGLWAHSVAAACGALVGLLILRAAGRKQTWLHHVLAMTGALLACLVRNEGLVLTIGAGIVLVGLGLISSDRWGRRLTSAMRLAGPTALAGVGGYLINHRLASALTSRDVLTNRVRVKGGGWLEGKVSGGLRTLVDGAGASPIGTLLGMLVIVLLVMSGRALLRSHQEGIKAASVLLTTALVGLAGMIVLFGMDDFVGLLVAAPVLAIGVGAFRWRAMSHEDRTLAAFVLITAAGVLATQSSIGGGREWGGRYLAIVAVPAMVVAVSAIGRALQAGCGWRQAQTSHPDVGVPRRLGSVPGVLLALLVLVPSIGGIWATQTMARHAYRDTEMLADFEESPVVVTAEWVPRLGWRHLPEADWLSTTPDAVEDLLIDLRPTLDGPIRVVGPGAADVRAPGYDKQVDGSFSVRLTPVEASGLLTDR